MSSAFHICIFHICASHYSKYLHVSYNFVCFNYPIYCKYFWASLLFFYPYVLHYMCRNVFFLSLLNLFDLFRSQCHFNVRCWWNNVRLNKNDGNKMTRHCNTLNTTTVQSSDSFSLNWQRLRACSLIDFVTLVFVYVVLVSFLHSISCHVVV